MKFTWIYVVTLCVVFLLGFSYGKSIEDDEEKTNEIKDSAVETNVTDELGENVESNLLSTESDSNVTTDIAETTAEIESTEEVTTEVEETDLETTEPPTTTEPTTRQPEQCNADPYCMGELLPSKIIINNTFILCDQTVEPKNRCCLPNGPHLVCYNIMVDGMYLNYDVAITQLSTDITGLCKTLIESQKEVQGQYTAASIESGGGTMVYNYNKWSEIEEPKTDSPQHIKDLACEIIKK